MPIRNASSKTMHSILFSCAQSLVTCLCACAVSAYEDSSKGEGKRVGRIVGIVFGCVGALAIACGVAYLWWTKKESGDLKIYTQAPKD